jgi:CRP-like cAMP-binding protein
MATLRAGLAMVALGQDIRSQGNPVAVLRIGEVMTDFATQENFILASLPESDRYRVVRLMEPVDLPLRKSFFGGADESRDIYFPTSGMASIVIAMAGGAAVECGVVGPEGWIGAELFVGALPGGISAFQQIAGGGLRMNARDFAAAAAEVPTLREALERFEGVLLAQAMQTAACNRLHDAASRCARWLLLCAQRIGRTEFAITHDFIGEMLGASRSVVSATMQRLETQGMIEQSRGHVRILDREGMEHATCECHAVLAEVYRRYETALAESR